MATRRRGRGKSDNDDIRARLGIEEAPEPEPEPESEEIPSEIPSDIPEGAPPEVAGYAHEDYAEAVAEPEDAPVEAPQDDWRADDVSDVSDASGKSKIMLIGAIIALIVGIGVGIAIGKVSEANAAVSRQTHEAQKLEKPVQNAAKRLATLKASLEGMALNPKSKDFAKQIQAFDTRLAQDLTSNKKIDFSTAALKGSSMVLANGDAGPLLTQLAATMDALESQVKRHQAITKANHSSLEREIEGTQDEAQYAIIFNAQESRGRLKKYMEDPESNTFSPVPGMRVTLPDHLDVTEHNGDYYYNITLPNGQEHKVPIYAVIALPRKQLMTSATSVSNIKLYLSRANKLKTEVAAAAQLAKRTQKAIHKAASH